MSWPNEETLERELRNLDKSEPPPDALFVARLEQQLLAKARGMARKSLLPRVASISLSMAAAGTAIWLMIGVQHPLPMETSEQVHKQDTLADTPASENKPLILEREQRVDHDTAKEGNEASTYKTVKQVNRLAVQQKTPVRSPVQREQGTIKSKVDALLQERLGPDSRLYQLNEVRSRAEDGYFVYDRMINGIPFLGDSYDIRIDEDQTLKELTHHESLTAVRDQKAYPDPAKAISKQQAEEAIAKTFRLVYTYDPSRDGIRLLYQPHFSGYVNAETGEVIQPTNSPESTASREIPVEAKGKHGVALSAEQGKDMLESEFGIACKGTVAVYEKTSSVSSEKNYKWDNVLLRTDKGTGRVIGYTVFDGWQEVSEDSGRADEAQTIAVEFLQKYLSEQIDALQVESIQKKGSTVTFQFVRSSGGVPVVSQRYTVTVRASDGKVTAFSGDFLKENKSLPSANPVLSTEAASAALLKSNSLQLSYYANSQTEIPYLVYAFISDREKQIYVDAITGELIPLPNE